MKSLKKIAALGLAAVMACGVMAGCQKKEKQVIFYSNADEEAKLAMQSVLDAGGYAGKYLFQSFGTSELGGKLLAEGTNIEADAVTMSTYYLESAQNEQVMFKDLSFDYKPMAEKAGFYAPFALMEGAIMVNTEVLAENNLPAPTSLSDLAKPEYKGMISVVDVMGSSTAWLMVQALISEYGEEGAKELLTAIYDNAGAHIETSGSGPIKKARAGEVAIGFGLRHQAVADKLKGLPIDYVDPSEGNFSLQEGLAVVDKGDKTNPLAEEMVEYLIKNVRPEIQKTYPGAVYEGEEVTGEYKSAYPKVFSEPLTVELLKKHQDLSESCK